MKIILDLVGGDYTPLEAIKGAKDFLNEEKKTHLVLVGTESLCVPLLKEHNLDNSRYTFVPSTQVIEMNEHPTKALKEKPNSSISIGFSLLQTGNGDAFISAGNTGAMLVGTAFTVKSIEGVLRPVISSPIPKADGSVGLLLDVGLNTDCKPEYLDQFATLGTLYAKEVLGIPNPKLSLLNVGEEEGKGDILSQAVYPLLKANKSINFIGNIEGRDLLFENADVVVCDGFVGNVILKTMESFYKVALKRKIVDDYFKRFNFELYGGTPIIGANKPVIIGHGISTSLAFKNMLYQAQKMINNNLCGKIRSLLSK